MFKVAKPFTTRNRRFTVGAAVTEAEVDGAMSFAELIERGFIASLAAPAEPKPSRSKAKEPAPQIDIPGA